MDGLIIKGLFWVVAILSPIMIVAQAVKHLI